MDIRRAKGRTTVFSGTKKFRDHVPRLEQLCIQNLLNNVNKIENVGDVPYYILKPLLSCISMDNLRRIELLNPQLVEDPESDELWRVHCSKQFDSRIPSKGETWRQLFKRCEKEKDNLLRKVTKKIKMHEQKTDNMRRTHIVNNVTSSPSTSRHIISGGVMSSGGVRTIKEITAVPLNKKQKTGPLMQKSMQLFKNRYRRQIYISLDKT